MKPIALAFATTLAVLPAQAQEAQTGSWGTPAPDPAPETAPGDDLTNAPLSVTEARLAALPNPTPDDLLALGALRFLRAIEVTLQTRWAAGMSTDLMGIPVLRLPVPTAPDPGPPDPTVINRLFEQLLVDLAAARTAFDAVETGSGASVTLDLGALWFDIDGDGQRGAGEGVAETAAQVLMLGADATPPVVRFDASDAAWASAYTHLLSGLAELILAFDPAPQIARVMEASRAMEELGAPSPFGDFPYRAFGREIDLAAMVYFSLQQQPDPDRTRAAHAHLLDMIVNNRVFWARVEAETDNQAEWIPNDRQSSALPIDFPKGLGAQWAVVLDDAQALLTGDKLIPFWRMRSGAGINLRLLMEDPPPVDIAEWVHGAGLLPYAETGPRVTLESLIAFEALAGGDAPFFMFVVN